MGNKHTQDEPFQTGDEVSKLLEWIWGIRTDFMPGVGRAIIIPKTVSAKITNQTGGSAMGLETSSPDVSMRAFGSKGSTNPSFQSGD